MLELKTCCIGQVCWGARGRAGCAGANSAGAKTSAKRYARTSASVLVLKVCWGLN